MFTRPDPPTPSPDDAASAAQLQRIALAAVQLGALGPRLAQLAEDMATQARDQATRAKTVADNMEQLTLQLETATRELRGSSAEVERALATVSRIADHTRIIAINASIEASRAGEHGRPFSVVVQEVQRLADRTGETTGDIERRVRDMYASLDRVTALTGSEGGGGVRLKPDATYVKPDVRVAPDAKYVAPGDASASSVGIVNQQIREIATSAHQQLESAQALKTMGSGVKTGTDALLVAVGTFRFAAHARAQGEVEQLGVELATLKSERARLEVCVERWLQQHPHFELAYVTNHTGRQIVDNIVGGRSSRHDTAGFNRDWSARPWYLRAVEHHGAISTDIYRSSATGDFCFTVALALRDRAGAVARVIGADVNFQQLVAR